MLSSSTCLTLDSVTRYLSHSKRQKLPKIAICGLCKVTSGNDLGLFPDDFSDSLQGPGHHSFVKKVLRKKELFIFLPFFLICQKVINQISH